MRFKLVLVLMAIIGFGTVQAQSKKQLRAEKRMAEFSEISKLVEEGGYEFVARSTTASSGKHVDLTTNPNYIRANDNEFQLYMPFFGRAYSAPYGGSGAFDFTGEPDVYEIEVNKEKMVTTIKSEVKTKDDKLRVTLKVSFDGYATLTIQSNNREIANYFGMVSPYEPTEEEQ